MSITTTTLQTLFGSPYQRSAWLEMLETLLPTKQFATPFFRENSTVAHFYQLGSIDLADGKELGVYEIKTQPETQLQRNRVQMRQLVAKECSSRIYDGALAVYYDDRKRWRFSFISMEYKLDEQGQLDRSESAPKRYTYLLGENAQIRTAVERFSKLGRSAKLQDLIDAFAVAQLNKEFYQKLFEWYEDAKTRVVFPNDLHVEEDDHKSTSLIRLLTRLLFVWFIKEKQLVNADLFDEEKVKQSIHWDKDGSYYKAILQNLFLPGRNTARACLGQRLPMYPPFPVSWQKGVRPCITFPQAPLSSRTVGFPESGWQQQRFPRNPSHPIRSLSTRLHSPLE